MSVATVASIKTVKGNMTNTNFKERLTRNTYELLDPLLLLLSYISSWIHPLMISVFVTVWNLIAFIAMDLIIVFHY